MANVYGFKADKSKVNIYDLFKTKSIKPTDSVTINANSFGYLMFSLEELEDKVILGIREINGTTLPIAEHVITSLGDYGYRYQIMFINGGNTSATLNKADINIKVMYLDI